MLFTWIMPVILTQQTKNRRLQLNLQQKDMHLRTGMSQQQFQHIEAGGNPRLNTLALIAEGLDTELMLIPKEKMQAIKALLSDTSPGGYSSNSKPRVDAGSWSDIRD